MAKNNLFLGFGRGSLGDVVMYRAGGEQISRARNRSPKNPRTPLQLCQRVLLRTASQAYSIFAPLADHAFQGYQQGTPNQSRFMALNVQQMRDQIATAGEYDTPEDLPFSELVNFSGKTTNGAVFRPWIISDGNMPVMATAFQSDGTSPRVVWPAVPSAAITVITYAELAAALGVELGDQLTFVWIFADLSPATNDILITDMKYSRVILMPADGNTAGAAFQAAAQGSDYYVMKSPNAKNVGNVFFSFQTGTNAGLVFYPTIGGVADVDATTHTLVGIGCIASRLVGNVWQRSRCQMLLRSTGATIDYNEYELGDAIRSYMTSQHSSLYLNQAENF